MLKKIKSRCVEILISTHIYAFFWQKYEVHRSSHPVSCPQMPPPSPLLFALFHLFFSSLKMFFHDLLFSPPSPVISPVIISNTDQSTLTHLLPCLFFPLHLCSRQRPSRKRRRKQDQSWRLIAEGAGHHLFVFTLPPPGRRRREEGMES